MAFKIKIEKSGVTIRNGQMSIPATSPLHPHAAKIGRDGRVQKHSEVRDPAIAWNMKSQTRPGGVHGWLHGQCENDSADVKLHLIGKTVPVACAMDSSKTQNQRGTDKGVNAASEHLQAAGRLGRKP